MGAAQKRSFVVYASDSDCYRERERDYPTPASIWEYTRTYAWSRAVTPTTNPLDSREQRPIRARSYDAFRSFSNGDENTQIYTEKHSRPDERREPREEKGYLPSIRRAASLPTLRDLCELPRIAPLTHQNLALFSSMEHLPGAQLITPDRSVSSFSRSHQPKNLSPSKASSSYTDAGAKMELANLMGDDVGAEILALHSTFHDNVLLIVEGDRHSTMKPESIAKFRRTLSKVRTRNETTLATRLMPYLVKDDRLVQCASEADVSIIRQDFESGHLDWNLDADFKAGSVPIPARYAYERDLERVFGIKNPKPDVVFGFNPSAFASSEKLLLQRFDAAYGLSKGILSPFLVVEWKSSRGSMEECKYQARRAGAAMVSARQQLRAVPKQPQMGQEPDIATAVFSCTINTDLAHIHVHWCQKAQVEPGSGGQNQNGEMQYHMAVITKYHLGDDVDIVRLRRGLHNIIDWNLHHRRNTLGEELRALEECYQQETLTREAELGDDGRESPEPTRKRRRVTGE